MARIGNCVGMRLCLIAIIILLSCVPAIAWSSNQKAFRTSRRQQLSPMDKYLPRNIPDSNTAQNMLRNPRIGSNTRKNLSKISNSVLASCDTLPSFPTAHGLLSPETVLRLEELTRNGRRSEALVRFLTSYRQNGPMSCLPMLSDPDVLPHLTQAMRDIAA